MNIKFKFLVDNNKNSDNLVCDKDVLAYMMNPNEDMIKEMEQYSSRFNNSSMIDYVPTSQFEVTMIKAYLYGLHLVRFGETVRTLKEWMELNQQYQNNWMHHRRLVDDMKDMMDSATSANERKILRVGIDEVQEIADNAYDQWKSTLPDDFVRLHDDYVDELQFQIPAI
ncbi:hypothetical protein HSE3_gp008 [Bacillus phage vB_BceM-HSE3]|nr:hypothetical protein HSE3_gp008 [Bacillus phage vB_BceM-HSE3]